jgi:predicted transcriptional regulator
MFMIYSKTNFMKKTMRVRERREKTGGGQKCEKTKISRFGGALQKMQETQNMIHDSQKSAARNNNKNKKKVIRSMSCRVSSNSLKSQQVCYILHPCAEALFAFVTRDDG